MAANHKLTKVLQGRTISGTANQSHEMKVHFTDGSTMTVKTAGNSNSASSGGTVKAAQQRGENADAEF